MARRGVTGLSAFVATLTVVLLGACQPEAADSGDRAPSAEPSARETAMAATVSDSLRLWLQVPKLVGVGEAVPITFGVENVADGPVDLHLRGRVIGFDLVVTDSAGDVTWRRLEGEVLPAILRIETLEPGRTLRLEDSWNQRSNAGDLVGPGAYTVHAELLTEEEPLVSPTASLRIVQAP